MGFDMLKWFYCGAFLLGSAAAQQPIGEVQGLDASVRGAVVLSSGGTTIMSGSQVTAGASAASVKLSRGGELKICAGSNVTITGSANAREQLVALNNGDIETHYSLTSSADTVVTPDFRLMLPGPGDFHFAVGVRGNGDMCVKSLPGNTSSIIVNEIFGDATHQVRAGVSLFFHLGSVTTATPLAMEGCGCAAVTEVKPSTELGFPEKQSVTAAAALAAGQPVPELSPALPGVTTDKQQVMAKVDAPFVYRGEAAKDKEESSPASPAPTTAMLAQQEPVPVPSPPSPVVQVAAPAMAEPAKPPARKKWFQRLGSKLASIFR